MNQIVVTAHAHDRRQPGSHTPTDLPEVKTISTSVLHDTLTSHQHSKDFSYARADYLRRRVTIISLMFLALTPIWISIDILMLPRSAMTWILPARVVMIVALIIILLVARYNRSSVLLSRMMAGLLIGLPAAFYMLVMIVVLPDGNPTLVGYSFIPYMLTTLLGIFPFTLLESAIAGLAMLAVQLFSQHVSGTWMTAAGLQESGLLSALLIITLTANHFHLVLLLRLYREATHDPLTGLLNRGALNHRLEQLLMIGWQPTLSPLMIDLDQFKNINDQHGHSIGDQVLRQFGTLLRHGVRHEDLVARYGGDEFVVVLVGTDKAAALLVAEKIRRQAEHKQIRNHDNQRVPFTVSIGVTTYRDGEDFHSAFLRADARLYKAKRKSRNCVVGD